MNEPKPIIYVIICEKRNSTMLGYKEMLSDLPYEFIYKVVKSEEEVLELLEKSENKLVIFGLRKEQAKCFEVIITIKMESSDGKFMVISDNEDRRMIRRMLDVGILGYLHDCHNGRELRDDFERVMAGKYAFTGVAYDVLKEKLEEDKSGKIKKVKKFNNYDQRVLLLYALQDGKSARECIDICGYEKEKDVTNEIAALQKIFEVKTTTKLIYAAEDDGTIKRRGEG